MPTYEYQCQKCGHRFEKFQSIMADPIKKCPKCGKKAVQRLISGGAGLIFKGSGFYITDYRDSSYTDKAKAESGESKPAETAAASDSKSGDSKSSGDQAKPAAAETKPKDQPKPKAEPKSTKRDGKSAPAKK